MFDMTWVISIIVSEVKTEFECEFYRKILLGCENSLIHLIGLNLRVLLNFVLGFPMFR